MRDARSEIDAAVDAPPVGRPLPTCLAQRQWRAEFDTSPLTLDGDDDGVIDWTNERGRTFMTSQLQDGLWRPEGMVVLDTRPRWPFNTRTLLFVRFQSLTVTSNAFDAWGALAWVNLNNDQPRINAVYLSLKRQAGGGQTLHLAGNGRTPPQIVSFTDLPDRLIDAALDLDPVARTVDLWIDGEHRGQFPMPQSTDNPRDEFATAATFQGQSVFDSFRLVSCRQ